MKKHNRIAGLGFVLFGLATGYHAVANLKLGSLQHPDSGFVPFLASLLMVACAAFWVLGNLGKDEKYKPFWAPGGWYRPTVAVALLLLYALGMEPAGYVLATFVFMLAWQWLVERASWKRVAVISVVCTVVMWLLFEQLLKVPLPDGLLTL